MQTADAARLMAGAVAVALALAMAVTPTVGATTLGARLAAARWRSRPVVVIAPAATDPRFQAQLAAFQARPAAMTDYAIALIPLAAPDAADKARLGLTSDFAVILIGKDGGEKGRWTAPVDPQVIFAEIDTMPMRRDERRR
jgi:hypothetical protein